VASRWRLVPSMGVLTIASEELGVGKHEAESRRGGAMRKGQKAPVG